MVVHELRTSLLLSNDYQSRSRYTLCSQNGFLILSTFEPQVLNPVPVIRGTKILQWPMLVKIHSPRRHFSGSVDNLAKTESLIVSPRLFCQTVPY